MVFYLALLPSLIDLSGITVFGIAELVAVMMLVLIAVDLAWVIAAAQARRWLKSSRAMRIANRVSATAMGGAAIAIAAK
jgi:threonine/homoserine/homoserine lactone efflux protein